MKKEVIRSADELVNMLKADKTLFGNLQNEDATPKLEELARQAATKADIANVGLNDPLVYKVAIFVLGILAVVAAIGSIVLAFDDKTTPEVLVALGSASVGALVGLFAPSPAKG